MIGACPRAQPAHEHRDISCTHRRRHKRGSSKRRDEGDDDGGNSGGSGCSDEVSRMGSSGDALAEAIVQGARRLDKFLGDEHDDEGGSGQGDVGTTTDALADAVEALGALGASSSFGGTAIVIARKRPTNTGGRRNSMIQKKMS